MTWFKGITASYVSDFRCKRKFHGYLFLACALLLLVVPVNSRSKEAESDVIVPLEDGLSLSEEYGDADNIEFHQAQLVNGVLQEDHPVIMYKEDFVSEDFVPKKNKTHRLRKHKDPAHRRRRIGENTSSEKYHPLQPEKIYFDILSPSPLVTSDESKAASSKSHVEVISLADEDAKLVQSEDEVKRVLNKRPKKFHHHRRQRRNADQSSPNEHIVRKRNPYYSFRKASTNANSISGSAQIANYYLPSFLPVKRFEKHPVPGDYFNGPVNVIQFASRFGGPSNTDRVIWRDYTPTRNPNERLNITVGAPAPLFPRRTTPAPLPTVTAVPSSRPTAPPSFANAGSVHHSVVTDAPAQNPAAAPPTPSSSSACVWAIASCCAPNDRTVRYNCFQRYGCNLVFFDLNPCADNIRDNIVEYLNQQFE